MTRVPRKTVAAAAAALGLAALTTAAPAHADTHTVTLSVGPVSLPLSPVAACLDGTCVTSPALTSVSLSVAATTDTSVTPSLATVPCPNGALGAAVKVTTATTATVTLSADVTGTSPNGPVDIPLGPKTITVSTPGVIVSACTF